MPEFATPRPSRRALQWIALICVSAIVLSGCGPNLLLRVYTVTGIPKSRVLLKDEAVPTQAASVGLVKLFFYPFVRDSVIRQVPELEFVTDYHGRAEYLETVSPIGDKMGALVSMKVGYLVDTLLFSFDLNDTVTVLIRMQPRQPDE